MELVKSRGGSDDDDKASYWDLLPFEVQERIVKESEVMPDMDKAREKAQQWEQVHNKLPRCHRHVTVGIFSFFSTVRQGDLVSLSLFFHRAGV